MEDGSERETAGKEPVRIYCRPKMVLAEGPGRMRWLPDMEE